MCHVGSFVSERESGKPRCCLKSGQGAPGRGLGVLATQVSGEVVVQNQGV